MADDDNNLLIWQFLSVSQQLTSNFLVCLFGYSPSALLFSWFTMSVSGPFVLCFDCCCCIMWYQEQHWKAKSQARGETLQSVSHQQSTRFTRRRDLDLCQSTNTPLCSSLFVSLKQSWRLAPKMSHTRHQNLSFSSAPRLPSVASPFDTCCLVAPVERLATIWWQLNRAVLPTSSTCVEVVVVVEGGGCEEVGGGVIEKSCGVWRQIGQPDSEFAPLLLTPSCSVASMTPKGHQRSPWRNLELRLKN